MRSPGAGVRSAVGLLAIFTVLFGPASDEWLMGSSGEGRDPIEARILAPALREAWLTTRPKVAFEGIPWTEPGRSPVDAMAAVSAAAGMAVAWALFVGAPSPGKRESHLAARLLIPRGPPAPVAL